MDSEKNNQRLKTAALELVKFNIVGIINTAITYGLYSLLVFLGVMDLVALCIEYPIGIFISFYLNKNVTFRFKQATLYTFMKMVTVYIPSLAINFALLWFFTTYAGLNSYLAQFISLAIVTIASFFLQKHYVFSDGSKKV
jgi:putative flippase GtrA